MKYETKKILSHGKVIGIHMHARLSMDKCGEFALQRSAVGFKAYEEETQHFAYLVCTALICVQINEF